MLEGLKTDLAGILNKSLSAMGRFVNYRGKGYGGYGYSFFPMWGRGEKIKVGDVESMIKANVGWVYNCMNVLAMNCAKVPMKVYKPTEFEDKLVKDHPFYKLLKNPNKFQSSWDFKYLFQAYLDLTGNAYILPILNAFKRPAEVWLLPSQYVTVREENNTLVYDYTGTGTMQTFSMEQIIHVKYPNPESVIRGLSPLEASRMPINLLEYMGQYNLSLMSNSAQPRGLLSTEQAISEPEAERGRILWKKKYGGIDKVGEIAIMGHGLKYQQLSLSPTDLEYLKSREFTQEEIAAAFGVPPHKLGRLEDVNKSNAHELEHSFQKDSISPRLMLRDMYLTNELISLYDPSLIVKSDNVVPIDKEFMKAEEDMDLTHAVITINEVRGRRGMKPVPYGDKPLVPFNYVQLNGGIAKPPSIGKELEKELKAFEEMKQKHLEMHLKRLGKNEKLMIDKLQTFFDKQEKTVLRNLRKLGKEYKDTEVYLPSQQVENEELLLFMIPLVTMFVVEGGETLIEDFGLGIPFDGNSPYVKQFFKNREKLIKDINNTTFKKLKQSLNEGINNGETMKELAGRVETVFKEAKGPRAMKIARTESNTAINYGHHEAMRQAGVERHEWNAAHGPDMRDEHEMNEMEGCIPLEQAFSGTGEVSPGEVNCQCEEIPCLEDFGK